MWVMVKEMLERSGAIFASFRFFSCLSFLILLLSGDFALDIC